VVVARDGKTPGHLFTLDNDLWDKFDKLGYTFECTIDKTTKETAKALEVKRWHVQALDNSDNNPAKPQNIYQKFRITEGSNFRNSYTGSAKDKAHTWEFNANSVTLSGFGEKMKNTYTFVYTGHGAVMCRDCHKMYKSLHGPSDADFGKWTECSTAGCGGSARSTHCVGGWKPAGTPSSGITWRYGLASWTRATS